MAMKRIGTAAPSPAAPQACHLGGIPRIRRTPTDTALGRAAADGRRPRG
jgi:hypothetical protein